MQTSADIKSERNQWIAKRLRWCKNALKPGCPIGLHQGQFLSDSRKEEIKQLLMQNIPITVCSKLHQKEEYILQKLNADATKAAIARKLGVSRKALFNKLAQMGWQETNPYRKKKIDLNLFLKAFNEGKTYEETAAVFQCHKQTIINKVKELQLSRNKKHTPERQEKRCISRQVKEGCFR